MPNIMMTFISSTFFSKDFIPSLHLYNSITCKRLQVSNAYFRKLKKIDEKKKNSIVITMLFGKDESCDRFLQVYDLRDLLQNDFESYEVLHLSHHEYVLLQDSQD